ncbi:MAG: helix-turn-helix domain-containing protein [Ruminococcaceae bacterium]|nr:helix-turn-helix domain-containing protein [Oscillospiraceae bacterium]
MIMKITINSIQSIYRYKTDRKAFKAANPTRSFHILSYQEYGHYDHYVNGKEIPVKKDMIFFINGNDNYSVKCREYGESLCITFVGETVFPTMTIDCADNPEIKNLFRKLTKLGNIDLDYNALKASAIMYEIFAYMSKKENSEYVSPDKRGKIKEIHSYIYENYKKELPNSSELSAKCGIAPKYFRTLFRKMYGITPTQYIIELRLNAAAELLSEGILSVGEVAEAVGFSDVYYFSKLFKKHFLSSPKNYKSVSRGRDS